MTHDELEARFLEILAEGDEPMEAPEIREAVAMNPSLADRLRALREFVARLDDLQWPELDPQQNIDPMTRAFDEGLRQGRAEASQRLPQLGWLDRLPRLVTAAAAVFVAIIAGAYLWQLMDEKREMVAMRTELEGLRETVAVSLLENDSATQRLRGLQWSREVEEPGEELLFGLSNTLRADNSVNVRLAAADAMSNFATDPRVRNALYETVLSERNPLVQVEIIDVLLVFPEQRTQAILKRLLDDPEVSDVVRLRAKEALNEMGDL